MDTDALDIEYKRQRAYNDQKAMIDNLLEESTILGHWKTAWGRADTNA